MSGGEIESTSLANWRELLARAAQTLGGGQSHDADPYETHMHKSLSANKWE